MASQSEDFCDDTYIPRGRVKVRPYPSRALKPRNSSSTRTNQAPSQEIENRVLEETTADFRWQRGIAKGRIAFERASQFRVQNKLSHFL